MTVQKQVTPLPLFEFVILMALTTSLGALSIDAILPALPEIGRVLNVQDSNDVQLIVSMIMLGMAIGQIVYGPLCDSWGRKPALYSGIAVFIAGSLISMTAQNIEWMLFGRVIQGLGLASTRVVSMALVRDMYSGRSMSRVMSFIMMVFIIVPMIAPTIGQFIIHLSSWIMVFATFMVLAIFTTLWFGLRQHETLTAERRKKFAVDNILLTFKEVLTHKTVMLYTFAMGFVFGCFLAYLSASQAIFEQVYGIVDDFPKYFAAMAGAFGLASFFNSRLVMRLGMAKMVYFAIAGFICLAIILLAIALSNKGIPPFWLFFTLAMPMFFTLSIIFANLNAMAMQPLGHIAGTGAAVVGSLSTFISVICAVFIGQSFHGTLTPFLAGYVVLGICAAVMILLAHRISPASDD